MNNWKINREKGLSRDGLFCIKRKNRIFVVRIIQKLPYRMNSIQWPEIHYGFPAVFFVSFCEFDEKVLDKTFLRLQLCISLAVYDLIDPVDVRIA